MDIQELWSNTMAMFRPPRVQTVSQWADSHRVLVSESSSEPGRWRTDRAPYQQEIMDAFTQPGISEIVVMASSQVGKALDVNTLIPTPTGWKRMGDLLVGDKVYDENGRECSVTAATEVMHDHPCYEVVFSDGNSIVADAEHRWSVDCIGNSGRAIGRQIKTTEEMSTTFRTGRRNTYSIPVAKALECDDKELPIPPYTLGAWLGDGNTYAANLTQAKSDTPALVRRLHMDGVMTDIKSYTDTTNVIILDSRKALTRDGVCVHGHDMNVLGYGKHGQCAECQRQFANKSRNGVETDPVLKHTMYYRLTEAGLIGHKHIPDVYLRAGINQRMELLQGLMDTDGTCGTSGRCEITLTESLLARDVSELLHSLGIKHTAKYRTTVCTTDGKRVLGAAWRISFLTYADTPVFTFERKLSRMKARGSHTRTGETESRRIVDIRPVDSRPVRCITVDSENHLYLAGDAMIPTHNSEIELNMLGRAIDVDPGPMLYVQPTDAVAEDYSKRRIAPMIAACPTLREKVYSAKSRDSSNTITMKSFPGGSLAIIGANSPADLASKPVRYIFLDEIDRFPASAGTEGNPIELAERRTETFRHNRKIVKTSTPTIKGRSAIEKAFLKGTQEEWQTECPHCGEYSFITFGTIKYDSEKFKDEDGNSNWAVSNVRWKCPVCGEFTKEHDTKRLPARWKVRNEKAIQNGIRSFRLNAFMSPWSDWSDLCLKFLQAKDDPDLLQVFVNTMLGESWEDRLESGVPEKMYDRRERYDAEVPDEVLVLTCGIDTQDNRLEYEVVGWDRNEQSWGISAGVIPGRPDMQEVWDEVDAILDRTWMRANGVGMRITATFIDSGGHFTTEVYRECYKRRAKRIWPIKGEGGENKPYVRHMKNPEMRGLVGFIIGVDCGKEAILYASGLEGDGPKRMHFPNDNLAGYDLDFFKGLISEQRVFKRRMGQTVVTWEQIYDRNEPLDCRNYARAAYKHLYPKINFDKREMQLSGMEEEIVAETRAEVERRKRRHIINPGIKI